MAPNGNTKKGFLFVSVVVITLITTFLLYLSVNVSLHNTHVPPTRIRPVASSTSTSITYLPQSGTTPTGTTLTPTSSTTPTTTLQPSSTTDLGLSPTTAPLHQYWVSPTGSDNNDGAQSYPFATVQKAAYVATPGTVIHVLPGTYTTSLYTHTSGTATERIVYISDVQWEAQIKSIGALNAWYNDGSYVDIIGFDVTGDGFYGINNAGSFVRIIHNHVHDMSSLPCISNGGAGIDDSNYGGQDDYIIGNVVDHIGPSTFCNFIQGIYQSNTGGFIWNNISYANAGWGIHLWHAANAVTVANNLIFENKGGGILIGAGDEPGGVTDDYTLVTNNIVIYNYLNPAIYEYGNTGIHNRYLNNLVFANALGISLKNGLQAQNTITADPQFVNYQPDGSGDYHLRANSPAINAGTSIGAPPTDMDNVGRPQGKTWDVGPFEYVFSS